MHPLNDPTEFGSLSDLYGTSLKEGYVVCWSAPCIRVHEETMVLVSTSTVSYSCVSFSPHVYLQSCCFVCGMICLQAKTLPFCIMFVPLIHLQSNCFNGSTLDLHSRVYLSPDLHVPILLPYVPQTYTTYMY